MDNISTDFFSYKGKPLVKKGNIIYYGSMKDEYVVMIQIQDTKKEGQLTLSNNIVVQLMRTGKDVKPQDMVVKKSEKVGMFSAMEIADIWLERALSE
ncbi:hypothetical protein RBG61_08375 [Paludicola sp. MB14-C6]|uniref:hypothetical protein n=1 Tax=Paludihabitans sp. MB14-C6 TaxID=3070656 RepID=UPI0027DD4328|nr:hypothetical protein [Paludicola sp. MB14-C6]WMJ22014.1 hypothetical protein RBG61_08375 [Paludicola sp. MB14-C6]